MFCNSGARKTKAGNRRTNKYNQLYIMINFNCWDKILFNIHMYP